MKGFPTLYKKSSTGKIQVWRVWVEPEGHTDHSADGYEVATIFNEYGVLGGKMQTATDVISEGKNIGKVNQTTPYEQACAEAEAEWTLKKRKHHYVESLADAKAGEVDRSVVTGGISPMLAQQYEKHGHKIKYPAFVQPKLDGHRCIAMVDKGKCTLWSRTQKPITGVPHVIEAIEALAAAHPNGGMSFMLDGELYDHEHKDKFEALSSYIRSATPKAGHEVVQYWVYDTPIDHVPFAERAELLKMFKRVAQSYTSDGEHTLAETLVFLETFPVESEQEMIDLFGVFLDQGYEGAMVRSAEGKYEGRRSYGLQKVKLMADAEFEIIDVEEGRGNMAGRAIFVCQTQTGERFNCKMEGSLDKLAEIWQNKADYIGKMLTVRYQNISAYGVPRFPVGVRLREDL